MVRVISVHHFTSEDILSDERLISEICLAPELNLLLLILPNEAHNIEVRSLEDNSLSHALASIEPIISISYSAVGGYILLLEQGEREDPHVRILVNWSHPWVQDKPAFPRIAGAVSPQGTQESLDVIEFRPIKGCPPVCAAVCPSTGNVAVAHRPQLIVIYRLKPPLGKKAFLDFQEILHIYQSFSPVELCLVEDVLGCLSSSEVHLFKIKIRETSDERKKRSLSVYSFCSDSEYLQNKSDSPESSIPPCLRLDSHHNNITLKRQEDSETSHMGHLDGYGGNVLRHRDHRDFDGPLMPRALLPEVEEANKEFLSLGSPRIMDQIFGPFLECPESSSIKIVVNLDPSRSDSEFEAECLTLLRISLFPSEASHEAFQNLTMSPVYWQKVKVKRKKEEDLLVSGDFSHPLQSSHHPHLMSLTFCFTSINEGYLYHIPGHLRRRGRGCGVQRIATYPFTSPVRRISLEPSLMHALTDTGLETYTLRSGYFTVMEAEPLGTLSNACPPGDIPICLVGLRPFHGASSLSLSSQQLILISREDEAKRQRISCLRLPSHFRLYKDMIELAEINQENSPQGCYQLLCEAHIVLRTWYHRLSWSLLHSSEGESREDILKKLSETQKLLNESCLKLAHYYVSSLKEDEWRLAVPYYRLSGAPIGQIIDECSKKMKFLPQGLIFYLTQVLLCPTKEEKSLDSLLRDKIIDILGENALDKLAFIVLKSPGFRSFKTKKMYDIFKKRLLDSSSEAGSSPYAEEVLAFALLCTNSGPQEEARELIRSLSNVSLSEILIEHHAFLLDTSGPPRFSDLASLIRCSVPEIFVEVLVSLIKDGVFQLGRILELFLGSFLSQGDNNSTVVLQLFLETYFVEYLENPSSLDEDIHLVLKTLIRSYLSCISTPVRFGDKNIDSDIFGPRSLYLELLPPFQHGGSRDTLLDAESPEFWCQNSLLKLQSLLCCSILVKDSTAYYPCILEYLSKYPETVGALSLEVLCSDNQRAVSILAGSHPEVLLSFCKERVRESEEDWGFILETLQGHLSAAEPNHLHHEGWYSSLQEILHHLAQTLPLETFMRVLPSPMQGNEDYQGYIHMCQKIQQAAQLQARIACTGQHLLSTLTL